MQAHSFNLMTTVISLLCIFFISCSTVNFKKQTEKPVETEKALKGINPAMEWRFEKQLDLKSAAVNMILSLDGQQQFILDEQGNLNIYKIDGALQGIIPVGKEYNLVQLGPEPDTLLLGNYQNKTVQMLTLDFIQKINIEGSPFKGPQDAPVTLILFSDFQCPYCAQMGQHLKEVLKAFPKELKLVYKGFPLNGHEYAIDAAKAAIAAHRMGKFWEFYNLLFKNYNILNKEIIDEIRAQLKLDQLEFQRYVNDLKTKQMIRMDYNDGIRAGVPGTPSLFLNGKLVKNSSVEVLKQSIESELEKAADSHGMRKN